MDYQKHYDTLIYRAKHEDRKRYKKTDSRYIYYEKHHIVPDCFYINRIRKGPVGWLPGNPNSIGNLVFLTPEEHYTAHLLLIKIYPNVHILVKSALLMCVDKTGNRINNKAYGWLKRQNSSFPSPQKGVPSGRSPPNKGKKGPVSPMEGKKTGIPSPQKGKKTGKPAHNRGIPGPMLGIKLPPRSTDHSKNISISN